MSESESEKENAKEDIAEGGISAVEEAVERRKTAPAREIIKKEYGSSKNFMTPYVIKAGKINRNIAFELSSGEGFKHEALYGVSFAEIKADGETTRRTDLSKMFYSQKEAEEYINQLKEVRKNDK